MLLTALLMAFHVSLAVHYCSGRMASVSVYGKATGICCCGGESDADAGRTYTYDSPGYLPDDGGSCCSDKILAVATDDYQTPSAVSVFRPETVVAPFVFVQTQGLPLNGIFASSDYQIIFPPGVFPASGIDLLTHICTFRI